MPAEICLIGLRFGKLKVIANAEPRRYPSGKPVLRVECLCDCGKATITDKNSLTAGLTRSCGCLRDATATRHGHAKGTGHSKAYQAWQSMKDRCLNPKARYFPSYGGRGIKVCERWLRFPEFLADVGEPPDPSLALGRIKNDKGYEPGNVRWETRSQQNQNTRRNRIYAVNGITGCMVVLARHFGLQPHVVKNRLVKGWSVDAAFTTPFVKGKRALRPNQTQQPPAKSP